MALYAKALKMFTHLEETQIRAGVLCFNFDQIWNEFYLIYKCFEKKSLHSLLYSDLRLKIAAVDKDYSIVNAKVEFWSSYRDKGAHEHKQQVS